MICASFLFSLFNEAEVETCQYQSASITYATLVKNASPCLSAKKSVLCSLKSSQEMNLKC